ncbi:MAG TPA: DUF1844 domain-containing protein [Kofleriaceae bacterium]|nr:DUF1844 domain-containing protein [Kofleriaceae bacterium]
MKEKGSTQPPEPAEDDEEAPQALPPLDFSTFVLSLASTAMVHLGQLPGPGDDTPERDLPAAKQAIDMLTMLDDKTRGNLDESEQKLLRSILYDLRVAFVDASKK